MAIALTALALVASAPVARAAPSGGVLVVGDSLEELSSPYLSRFLPGVPLTINAVGGYNSFQISTSSRKAMTPPSR